MFTTVTVFRDYDYADGVQPTGYVEFLPTSAMVNDYVTVVKAPRRGTLDSDGHLEIDLVANTDPDTVPSGTGYQVTEVIKGQNNRTYYVVIPHDGPDPLDLSSLDELTAPPLPEEAELIALLATKLDAETVRDTIAAFVVGGSGVTVTHDDGANSLTISLDGGYTDEDARDAIGAALVEAGYVDITVNDGADTITVGTTTSLQTALDGKAASSHTHVYSDLPLVKDPPVSLTFATPITWSAGAGGYRVCTMTDAATLNIPSGGTDGQRIWLRFIASGGSRTLTFHADYKRPSSIANTLVIPSGNRGDVGLHYETAYGWTVAAAQVV